MQFIYPTLQSATHKLTGSSPVSKDYPWTEQYARRSDYRLESGTGLVVIRENVGYECEWSEAQVIDEAYSSAEYFKKTLYIKNDSLVSINGKKRYEAICTEENAPVAGEPEVNILLKEVFLPFIDKKNALYSVRIQTDYEKALDSFLYQNLINDVLYEGVSILLSSRGLRSDNATIKNMLATYNTFAYVHDDLDKTALRQCEPLTFTVSIPLNFFNEVANADSPEQPLDISKTIKIKNTELEDCLNRLLNYLLSRAGDIEELTYPSFVIENYLTDFETAAIRRFAVASNELFQIAGYPLDSGRQTEYQLDFDQVFNLLKITITREGKSIVLNRGLLSQFKLRGEFNNKRIFNYLYLFDSLEREVGQLEILNFLNKYVNYPPVRLVEETANINGKNISGEKLKRFRQTFQEYREQCLNTGTINELVNDAFSDPIYHLFHKSDAAEPKKEEESKSFKQILQDVGTWRENTKKALDKGLTERPSYDIKVDTWNGIKEGFSNTTARFDTNINTLLYIVNRLNISKLVFEKVFCYLKGLNAGDPEVASLIARFAAQSPKIIQYFNYIKQIQDLKGAEYVRALNNGLRLDPNLFCIESTELVYFVKGLRAGLKAITLGLNLYEAWETSINDLDKLFATPQTESPYLAFGRAAGESLARALIDLVFQYITDLLATNCEDPRLQDRTNYADVFNSHAPTGGYGGKNETDNKNTISNNRRNVLDKVYSDPVQYGFDREYAVELISLLINDINCYLTPNESLSLLRGEAAEEIKILIKNTIRSRYSTPPNDLTFLLRDDDKLMLLFRELGLTVDQDLLKQVEKAVSSQQIPSDICGIPYDSPDGPIKPKTPDLGVLDRQRRTRILKAKQLLDSIEGGGAGGSLLPTINPFCSDLEDANVEKAKDHLVRNHSSLLDSVFKPIETSFNNEAGRLSEAFRETAQVNRYADEELIGSVEYDTYNRELGLNLTDLQVTKQENSLKILYKPLGFEQDMGVAESLLLEPDGDGVNYKVACPDDTVREKSKEFKDFLAGAETPNGYVPKIFLEFFDNPALDASEYIPDFLFDATNRSVGRSDLNEMWDESEKGESGSPYNSMLAQDLRQLEYFLVIIVDQNNIETHQNIIKLIYNDKIQKKFIIVGDSVSIWDDDLGNNIETAIVEGYHGRYLGQNTKVPAYDEAFVNNVYGISEDLYNRLSDVSRNKIQQAFDDRIKERLARIQSFITLRDQINKFNDIGIYNLESTTAINTNSIKRLNYAAFDGNGAPYEKNYITIDSGIKNINYSLSTQKVEELTRRRFSYDPEINGADIDLFSKFFYQSLSELNKNYIKGSYELEKDFTFLEADGWFSSEAKEAEKTQKNFTDADIKVAKNPKNTYWLEIFSKLNELNYPREQKFKNCNIFPSYLNYEYYKKINLNYLRDQLCNGVDNYTEDLGEIAAILYMRTAVTDYMVKGIGYWGVLTKAQFTTAYSDTVYIKILEEFVKKDIEKNDIGGLRKGLEEQLKRVYGKRTPAEEIKKYSGNNIFRYYVIREMKHFIDYCLYKNIIKFSEKSVIEAIFSTRVKKETFDREGNRKTISFDIEKNEEIGFLVLGSYISSTASQTTTIYKNYYDINILNIFEAEQKYMLMYVLGYAEINPNISTIFTATKSSLIKIIGENSAGAENESVTNQTTEDEYSLNQFLNNLAYSPAPQAMILLNPSYSKYIKFFLQATINSARSQLRNIAETSDPNVIIARRINKVLTPASIGIWSILEQEDRINYIKNGNDATSYLYKRLEDGRGILPDYQMGLIIWSSTLGLVFPGPIGWSYYGLDAAADVDYMLKASKEIRALKGLKEGQDPCEVKAEDVPPVDLSCSPQKRIALLGEVNSFEPDESN